MTVLLLASSSLIVSPPLARAVPFSNWLCVITNRARGASIVPGAKPVSRELDEDNQEAPVAWPAASRRDASGCREPLSAPKVSSRERPQEAQKRLANTSQSIGEISLAVGFFDQSHFTKLFKRSVDLTPSQFRKLMLLPKDE